LLWGNLNTVTPYRSSTKRCWRPATASEVVYHPGHSTDFSITLLWESFSTVTPYRSSTKWCCRPATESEVVYHLGLRRRRTSKIWSFGCVSKDSRETFSVCENEKASRFWGFGSVSKDCRETFSDCKVSSTIRPKSGTDFKIEKKQKK
jgi:hypothetical protein